MEAVRSRLLEAPPWEVLPWVAHHPAWEAAHPERGAARWSGARHERVAHPSWVVAPQSRVLSQLSAAPAVGVVRQMVGGRPCSRPRVLHAEAGFGWEGLLAEAARCRHRGHQHRRRLFHGPLLRGTLRTPGFRL